MFVAIRVFQRTGMMQFVMRVLTALVGIPEEVIPLTAMLSGSGV